MFFPATICSHYVYKTIWTTAVCQELIAKPDERKEALDYNKFSIVVFKPEDVEKNTSNNLALAGHVSMETLSLLYYALKADKNNAVDVKVT